MATSTKKAAPETCDFTGLTKIFCSHCRIGRMLLPKELKHLPAHDIDGHKGNMNTIVETALIPHRFTSFTEEPEEE